jgi:predicted transcriptional regulator
MEISDKKTNISCNILAAALKLSKLQTRAIFTGILRKPQPEPTEKLTERELFFLFIADMLIRIGTLSAEQQQLILSELAQSEGTTAGGLRQLIIVDGQYVTWTGQTGFIALDTGEKLETLADPPVETIGYNLDELYRRGLAKAEKNNNHVKKSTAGSMEKS